VSQLRQRERELKDKAVAACIVTFDAGPLASAYVRETELAWPLLVDEDRSLYKAYGMLRGSPWNLYGPAACWAYLKLLARGRRLHRPGSDVHQLGGDVLIDPEGIVQLHHVGAGPADRPAVTSIIERVGA